MRQPKPPKNKSKKQKGHGQNAAKLGKGQQNQPPAITTVVTGSALTATVTFSLPVVINGNPDLHVHTVSITSVDVVSPTEVQITYDNDIAGLMWEIKPFQTWAKGMQGNAIVSSSGTF